jgi:hypothetical protein
MSYADWLGVVARMETKPPKKKGCGHLTVTPAAGDGARDVRAAEQAAKPRVIQGELAVEIVAVPECDLGSREYITVGLHACGDLSIVTHEIALNSRHARGAISVPCCYQHLSAARLPLVPENRPICDQLFGDDVELRHNLLNYALYEYDADFAARQQLCQGFMIRAMVDSFIPRRVTVKKIPQRPGEALPDYILRAAAHFGREAARADIDERMRRCEAEAWKMRAHAVIREVFGHAFETFILIDRLTYLVKLVKEKPERFVVGMFDVFTHLSPRGFAMFTIKLE